MALKEGALKFVIFQGSVREGNYGSRVAKFMVKKLEKRGHQTTLLGGHTNCLSFSLIYWIVARRVH